LDEVQNNSTSILSQIKNFTNLYHRNKFVITCRTAAQNYVFQNFTEVEVADFDFQQIAIFTNKWFTAKNDIIKSRLFNQKLENNKRIQELATNQ
jgi:predicted NACHT family NTPase